MKYSEKESCTIIEEALDALNGEELFLIIRALLEKKHYGFIEEFCKARHMKKTTYDAMKFQLGVITVVEALLIDAMERGNLDLETVKFLCEKCYLNPANIGKIGTGRYGGEDFFMYTVRHCDKDIIKYLADHGMQLAITDYEGENDLSAEFIYTAIVERNEETWTERKSVLECIYNLGIIPEKWALKCAVNAEKYSEQMTAWVYERNPNVREHK